MEAAIPKKIDKYEVLGLIARGGMGVVYKAIDRSLERFVAIKMVTSVDLERADLLKRFYREAQFTARLRHENIVTVYDLGEFEGNPYLVMEYLGGKSLDALIEAESMSLQQKLNCVWQVCNGLQYAHSQQPSIIHRDIKPANILVSDEGNTKIIDFGIARLGQSRNTRTGLVMGSYQYMSPEQINGTELDGRSDIFSTGVVLYQLLSGQLPFAGANISEILQKVLSSPPAFLNGLVQGYPAKLDEIIQRALAKRREERYQSASEFAVDLMEVEGQLKRERLGADFAKAESLLAAGEYETARQELGRVLEFDPQNTHALELMRKVQRATARRQRKSRAQTLRLHAEEAVKMNRLAEALSYVDQALRLDGANAELITYRAHITALQAHNKELDEILTRAERAFAAENFSAASQALEEALRFDPNSSRARSFQAILQGKRNEGVAPLPDRRVTPFPAQVREETAEITGTAKWPLSKNASSGSDLIWSDDQTSAAWSSVESRGPAAGLEGGLSNPYPAGRSLSQRFVDSGSSDAITAPIPIASAASEGEASGAGFSSEDQPPVESRKMRPQPPSPWRPGVLRAAEEKLATFLGPMAKLVIRKAASRAKDQNELYELLAQSLEDPQQHNAFLTAFSAERRPKGVQSQPIAEPTSGSMTLEVGGLSTASLEQATQLLARYLGPLAAVLTKKAARRAQSLRALFLILSEHIANEEEREQFLREAGFRGA